MARPPLVINQTLSSASEYASADDFQELFASEMVDLFRLAFFLTADADKAEHCLILTMHECLANRSVFKRWLPVWIRNALIQNAIRVVMGDRVCRVRKSALGRALSGMHISAQGALSDSDESIGILHLSDFDRLVYVICVLESYTTRDCATLLGRSRQEIRDAQNRSENQVAAFEQEWRRACNGAAQRFQPPRQNEAIGSDGPFGRLVA
jgi:hypothetical protein